MFQQGGLSEPCGELCVVGSEDPAHLPALAWGGNTVAECIQQTQMTVLLGCWVWITIHGHVVTSTLRVLSFSRTFFPFILLSFFEEVHRACQHPINN